MLLLSLLPPSYMVVPIRESVNTLFPFILNSQSSIQESTNILNQQMDIEIDTPRGQSMSSSTNSSRESLTHSNTSPMVYADRIQALANSPMWAEQVESIELQSPSLSYVTVKDGMNNTTSMALVVEPEPTHVSHAMSINNTCTPQGQEPLVIHYANNQPIVSNNIVISQGPEPSVILYAINQPADPQL